MNSEHLTPGRHVVNVRGIQLAYEVRGKGPLLIWHPGGPGMAIQGYPGYEIITEAFTVVYLEPRGVGESSSLVELPDDFIVGEIKDMDIPGSEAYALERYSDDLAALQDLWGLAKINLAGHSHGGFVVFDYVTRYPERVDKVVIVGSAGIMRDQDPRYEERRKPKMDSDAYERYLGLYKEREAMGLSPLAWYQYGLMLQFTIDIHDFEAHEERLKEAIFALDKRGLSFVPAYHFEKHDIQRYDMRPRYKDITAQVLFLQGRQELLFFPEDIDEAVAAIPNARVVWLEDCAHMPMTEQPDAFMAALTSFIS